MCSTPFYYSYNSQIFILMDDADDAINNYSSTQI